MREVNGELKVSKIKNGTVIDHITAGMAPAVLRILGIEQGCTDTVIVAMNVRSQRLGFKDMVKVENRALEAETVKKIAIVAPQATVNIIKDFAVVQKIPVELPHELIGIVRCSNRNCVTNAEPIPSYLVVENREPLRLRCHYCETVIEGTHASVLLL
ncbi:MAG: aspartate carbamoyltransferase regulatory subunit [Candidatus Bipolaricaulota bacterium]|nr:aspartate carbamoyltransferase regulatory subunit [Candidatus Bipolaricaulota bacterium]MDW8030736.1 aspartate carbamoyltransferase regulatory subunit [Candidatus Bipolaricaulota bacterium]